jgi:hypothetical protein
VARDGNLHRSYLFAQTAQLNDLYNGILNVVVCPRERGSPNNLFSYKGQRGHSGSGGIYLRESEAGYECRGEAVVIR